jgi:hypothetical protein
MARTHRYAYAGAQKKLRFPGSLKAISANRYTDRACHPEHFWIAARCAACSHTPSASGCPHRVNRRNTLAEHMFSASPPTTDMRRLHRNDRFVPGAAIAQPILAANAWLKGCLIVKK